MQESCRPILANEHLRAFLHPALLLARSLSVPFVETNGWAYCIHLWRGGLSLLDNGLFATKWASIPLDRQYEEQLALRGVKYNGD